MRSILGLALLVAASLGGIEYATKLMPASSPSSAPQMQATLLAPALAPTTETFGGIVQTVAATQPAVVATQPTPLPPVTVAPLAPHAEPINPIVEPIKRPPPKVTVAKSVTKPVPAKVSAQKTKVAKAKPAKAKETTPKAPIVTVTRPGFKLTCTVAQKLDPAKQRCVPLKR